VFYTKNQAAISVFTVEQSFVSVLHYLSLGEEESENARGSLEEPCSGYSLTAKNAPKRFHLNTVTLVDIQVGKNVWLFWCSMTRDPRRTLRES